MDQDAVRRATHKETGAAARLPHHLIASRRARSAQARWEHLIAAARPPSESFRLPSAGPFFGRTRVQTLGILIILCATQNGADRMPYDEIRRWSVDRLRDQ
jgi:hypothetical protein